jgi:predicted metal-dependent hydrolase
MDTANYDPRYLAGIVLFNRGDYFEAHEVWETLWMDSGGLEKRFYQGLIQAAVGLCHFCNGNVRGAVKLYHSSREYMNKYAPSCLGLDLAAFWQQMSTCFAELLTAPEPDRTLEPREELLPAIALDPAPLAWPDPQAFLHDQEERR